MTFIYKVRDKSTGKFWSGDTRWSKFGPIGKSWKKKDKAEQSIGYYLNWSERFKKQESATLIEHWEIVRFKVVETEEDTSPIEDFLLHHAIHKELTEKDSNLGYFYDVMKNKGVINDIQFIIRLQKDPGTWHVGFEKILDARASLRQLGVKTRTFREYHGSFGMMDRSQAMRARLTLDVEHFIDLEEMRQRHKA